LKFVRLSYSWADGNLNRPIEALVSFNGEMLNSVRNLTTASWGAMQIDDNEITVALEYGNPYDIAVIGTGDGIMNIEIEFNTDDGQNKRSFLNVPIKTDMTIFVYTYSASFSVALLVVESPEMISTLWCAEAGDMIIESDEALTEFFLEYSSVPRSV